MSKQAKKAMVIGLDAPIIHSIQKYIEEGRLPNFQGLIEDGVWAENCLVPHPTITPPNWTTIATGAWPGTHGITCFHLHKPGMPFDESYQAFLSTDCQAEFIWEAAERVGKKSIILNYPTTWPPRIKEGIQIGGAGLHINEWRIDSEGKPYLLWTASTSLSSDQLFSTEEYPLGSIIEIKPAQGWKNASPGENLEAELVLKYSNARDEIKEQTWYLLIQNTAGKGYDRVLFCRSRDTRDVLASLQPNRWSEKIVYEFEMEHDGKKKGAFCCKLTELSADGKKLSLYLSPICQLDGWSYPEEVAKELENVEGLPSPVTDAAYNLSWIDVETYLELVDLEHSWLGGTANYLLKNKEWTLFYMHCHSMDQEHHAFIHQLDSHICEDRETRGKYLEIEAGFYESLDRMIGKIVEASDDETLIIVTSDHGAVPVFEPGVNVGQALEEAGLTVYQENPHTAEKEIDWSRTRAVAQRSVYVYVNLKGRDPQGIVEPGDEYEEVRDHVLQVLHQYTIPGIQTRPITLAVRKENARILGLYGNRIGDVVYAIRAGMGAYLGSSHGMQLSTAECGMGSMRGLFIMKGPGVKKNQLLRRTIWLTDIVPTICYLLDLPVPRNTEGAIIYQALEDPDFKMKQLEVLRKNYQRLQSAFKTQKSLTHSY